MMEIVIMAGIVIMVEVVTLFIMRGLSSLSSML